jgi:hypothetical protein
MPKVLTKLRIDEISAVTAAANEGAKVTLYKRAEPPPSIYHEIFRDLGKRATYRGGTIGSRLHQLEGLTREEAMHWLMHARHGRAFARERGEPLDTLADHLVEASGASSTNKRSADMATNQFVEVCKKLGDGDPSIIVPSEHELTAHIQKYASDHRRSGESAAAAFNRIYNAQDDEGLALRRAVQVTKRASGFPL